MRGLEDALARIARRDELRERSGGGRGGAHRLEGPAPVADHSPTPSVSPVVDEVTEALQAVVRRNPGVFATVVVQEADTAWSVWIGEWDGTLRTRVTRLEPDPPALPAGTPPAAEPMPAAEHPAAAEPMPVVPAPAIPPAEIPIPAPSPKVLPTLIPAPALVPAQRRPAPERPAAYQPPTPVNSATPISSPPRPVNGPAMNDRVAGRIADLLRREAARETHPA
jgi:hypothetical protein